MLGEDRIKAPRLAAWPEACHAFVLQAARSLGSGAACGCPYDHVVHDGRQPYSVHHRARFLVNMDRASKGKRCKDGYAVLNWYDDMVVGVSFGIF